MTNDIEQKKQEALQDAIARKITVQGSLCAIIPCILYAALSLFTFHMLTTGRMGHPLFWEIGLLVVQIIASIIIFYCLYLIARDVARQSIKPLQEALARER